MSYEPAQIQRVTVVDVDISFWQLVKLFVKAAIAMIPATLILLSPFILIGFLAGLLGDTP